MLSQMVFYLVGFASLVLYGRRGYHYIEEFVGLAYVAHRLAPLAFHRQFGGDVDDLSANRGRSGNRSKPSGDVVDDAPACGAAATLVIALPALCTGGPSHTLPSGEYVVVHSLAFLRLQAAASTATLVTTTSEA